MSTVYAGVSRVYRIRGCTRARAYWYRSEITAREVKAMNRDDYMSGTVTHDEFYTAVADAIGRNAVECIVLGIAPVERIKEALQADPHLNNIPLHLWDSRDAAIRDLVGRNAKAVMAVSWSARSPLKQGVYCWSLSDSVCVLKAAARRLANSEI